MTKQTGMRGRGPVRDIDDYLAAVPEEARASLEKLRKTIKSAAPKAVETISYGVPTFKLDGRPLVAFGAATKHCTFYLMSTKALEAHASELKGYKLGKGSIQFEFDSSLPAPLVKRLVKTRIEENEAGAAY
jgi:uncharacterized protein YdhG (YjbR/CyaY superfamily)